MRCTKKTNGAICVAILDSLGRKSPLAHTTLVSSSLCSGSKWWKGQDWLLLGQRLNTEFKQPLTAAGAPWRGTRDERRLFEAKPLTTPLLPPPLTLSYCSTQHLPEPKRWRAEGRRHQRSRLWKSGYIYANYWWLARTWGESNTGWRARAHAGTCYQWGCHLLN